MADARIIGNFKSFADFQGEQEKNNLAAALMQAKLASTAGGGSLPAPIQVANEMFKYKQLASDPTQDEATRQMANDRYNLLGQAAKTYGFAPGVATGIDGIAGNVPGFAPAVGAIEAAKGGMKRQAESDVDLIMKPQIGQQTAFAEALGKSSAANQGDLKERVAQMPALEKTVAELSDLGKKATYTTAGRAIDTLRKEAQLSPRDSAIARADYIAKVDNQVLPLLRQTFGAAFTQKEGETLRNTLGDPNKSPAEKDSVLKAFIEQKRADIQTGIAQTQSLDDVLSNYQQGIPATPAAAREQFNAKKSALTPAEQQELNALRARFKK